MSDTAKGQEPSRKEVYASAMEKMRSSGPKVAINTAIAVLIWLIGNYVFIPISQGLFIQAYAVTQLVSFIILVALVILVLSIVKEIRDLTDAAAALSAYRAGENMGNVSQEELRNYRTAFRGFVYVLVAAAAFLLFGLQLTFISPALAAIVLLGLTAWAVYTLWTAGRALSRSVEHYAKDWADKMEERTQ